MAPGRDVGESFGGGNGNGRRTDLLLGELVAEMRAVKHNQQNATQKLDAINTLVEQVREMKLEQERHHQRIILLEADKLRREGAVGLVEWFSRHWPVTVIMAAIVTFAAWVNGKMHP